MGALTAANKIIRSFTFHWIAGVLPVQETSGIATDVLVPMVHQEVVGEDTGRTGRIGAIDDDLVILIEHPHGFLQVMKVE